MTGGPIERRQPLLRIAGRVVAALILVLATAAIPAASEEEATAELTGSEICTLIQTHANGQGIPADFLARLIWQESRFNRLAVSPKGAQGIAQFMPATARQRALRDPFDIPTSLAESAAFLAELKAGFGNLGLAAAAYNAGPERVRRWLAGEAGLPRETRHYVRVITGLSAEDWQQPDIESVDFTLDEERSFGEACARLVSAGLLARPGDAVREAAGIPPWGAQVAAHHSRDVALAIFQRLQGQFGPVLGRHDPVVVSHRVPGRGTRPLHAVRIGAGTRQEAEAYCAELRAIDGPCMVMKN